MVGSLSSPMEKFRKFIKLKTTRRLFTKYRSTRSEFLFEPMVGPSSQKNPFFHLDLLSIVTV